MPVTQTQADGLHLLTGATLAQLAAAESVRVFAAGLLATALAQIEPQAATLAAALRHPGAEFYPLLAALLALDAEVVAVVNDHQRLFPMAGFLSYRSRPSVADLPLSTLRLPPLNPAGHYFFSRGADGAWVVVRTDLHPTLRVAGHVRLVCGDASTVPRRLLAVEQRLERQVLTEPLIEASLANAGPGVSAAARRQIADNLRQLITPSDEVSSPPA